LPYEIGEDGARSSLRVDWNISRYGLAQIRKCNKIGTCKESNQLSGPRGGSFGLPFQAERENSRTDGRMLLRDCLDALKSHLVDFLTRQVISGQAPGGKEGTKNGTKSYHAWASSHTSAVCIAWKRTRDAPSGSSDTEFHPHLTQSLSSPTISG
jgi:hypothetical protein